MRHRNYGSKLGRQPAHRRLIAIPDFQPRGEIVGLSEIIDRRHVEQQVKGEFRIIAQDLRGRDQIRAIEMNPVVAAKALILADERAYPRLDLFQQGAQRGRLLRGIRRAVGLISGHSGGECSRYGF